MDLPFALRVATDKSHGMNSPASFGPALDLRNCPPQHFKSLEHLRFCNLGGEPATQVSKALHAEKAPDNPIVFVTISWLYALMHEQFKATRGEKNAYITCIDMSIARTHDSRAVPFLGADTVISGLNMPNPVEYRSGHVMDYSDVYLTTDFFTTGSGSSFSTLADFKAAGLYNYYPELVIIKQHSRHGVGLERPATDLRAHLFFTKRDLETEQINLAARLAASFQPVGGGQFTDIPIAPFAYLLSSRNQNPNGNNLNNWLVQHSAADPNWQPNAIMQSREHDNHALPEVEAFLKIYRKLEGRRVPATNFASLPDAAFIPRRQTLDFEQLEFIEVRKTRSMKRTQKQKEYVRERNTRWTGSKWISE